MTRTNLVSLVTALALVGSAIAHAAERSYAAGRFALSVDGQFAGYVRKVSGGTVKGEVVSHHLGTGNFQKKHLATISHEPLTMELDLSMGEPIWDWLKASMEQGHVMRDLALDPESLYPAPIGRELYDAVVTRIEFPALDGSSKDPCYLTATVESPELRYRFDGGSARGADARAGKKWLCSNFRFELGSLPADGVSRVEAITFTQALPEDRAGARRLGGEQAVAEVSNIKLTVSADDFDAWFDWFHAFVIEGRSTDLDEVTGSIELLDPAMGTLGRLELHHVGIVRIGMPEAPSNREEVARFEVELYVESIAFEYLGGE